ncbi:protein O-mannosyl-transferase Tmtc3 isoform X2 [Leptinotarsa decemlineata]|uniref:protein O-mannosyl-transferase Tmtc3 isoform X2 n=1 Tax=Leptinotarsa decemlineata TaxID=7539 RepID=UPI003D3075D6
MALNHALGAVIVLTCFLCYYNSYYCGFVFDDISAIKENRDLRPHSPLMNIFVNDFWGTPMHKEQSHKSYRPLCVLTFRWNYLLWQLEPMGYHLVNMLLHSVVCLMYFRMCSMFLPELSSFVAAMLFAVHPIHTEAVTGVVGRAETLSSVFFLAAFILYSKATRSKKYTGWKYLLFSMVSIATAMLCKEQGITVAGVCAAYEIFFAQKVRLPELKYMLRTAIISKSPYPWSGKATKRLALLASTTFCLLLARLQIMGSQLPVFTRFDNPASVAATPTRQLTYHYLISVNLWLLLFPCNLCCDWTMGTVPLVTSFFDIRNLATVAAYGFLIALLIRAFTTENKQQSMVIIMGTSMMVLPFIPASNLFFPVGFVVAERVLYMPSMGFCMLVGYGFHLLSQTKGKQLVYLFLCLLLLCHGSKTYLRNWDWENEYTIFMSGLRVNQKNAKLFNNVGHALESQGNFQEALKFFKTAVSVQEDDVGAHINVGRTYNHLKMFKEAEEAYLKAKSLLPKAKPGESYQARIAPNHLNVFLNLANLISKNSTRLEEADMLYRQAISMRADYTQAYINRGDILIKLNRTKEAQEVYERALLYDSNNPDIYYNCYRRILELDPENIQGLHNLCVVHVERGKLLEAQSCLLEAHKLAPAEDYVLKHLHIVQNRISKISLDSRDHTESDASPKEKSKVVSNKSIDETDKETKPVVSGDSEEQRYSSRVVNTEPMFVKNVDSIDYVDYSVNEAPFVESSDSNRSEWGDIGTDRDDPSSGMS